MTAPSTRPLNGNEGLNTGLGSNGSLAIPAQQAALEMKISPIPTYTVPEPRVVDIVRHPEFGLGISIVGGRQDESEQKLPGIFIKHVLETSPAGKSGFLKTGDQILEVFSNSIVYFQLVIAQKCNNVFLQRQETLYGLLSRKQEENSTLSY